MKKISSILFLATIISFVACKNSSTTEQASEAVASEQTTTTPEATPTVANEVPVATEPSITPTTPEAGAVPADAATAKPTGPITKIEFTETTYDFGTVKDGEKVTHNYKFKNTGKEPLIISEAKGSCGCTVPQWPREPIAPGKTGEIKVEFDSKGKGSAEGLAQAKKVTLTANTDPAQTFLNIKGIVKK